MIGRAAMALRDLSDKLKKKTDELDSKAFTVEKLGLDKLSTLISEVVVKAKPKAAGPEPKDPLSEPDPYFNRYGFVLFQYRDLHRILLDRTLLAERVRLRFALR